ncbi:MAG: AraC family transcriptional regulator [Ktedonobacterales bacterium]|nr:AraC family transcriptional regulator [Ktedonobacterales bacterium]
MLIFDEDRPSDSPYVERIWRCHSEDAAPFLSIAGSHHELVVSRLRGEITITARGPETHASAIGDCPKDGEWFGIILKLGTFLPHIPATTLVNGGVDLPTISPTSFWMFGSPWQFPSYDNADTFIARLQRAGFLKHDPYVNDAWHNSRLDRSQRTLQRHFLQATGLRLGEARQIERARQATYLLQQGLMISAVVTQAGYNERVRLQLDDTQKLPSGVFVLTYHLRAA